MRNRLLPTLLFALSAMGVGTWFFSSSGTSVGPTDRSATPTTELLPDRGGSPVLGQVTASERLLEDEDWTESEAAGSSRVAVSVLADQQPLRRWIEGRVVFPPDTPTGEHARVVTKSGMFTEPGPIEKDGSFRVAFPDETRKGFLELDATYLYLEEPLQISPAEGDFVLLEAHLGGVLRGRVIPPNPSANQALVGTRVTLRGSRRDLPDIKRRAELDGSLAFEFRSLPPNVQYEVSCDPLVFPALSINNLSVTPGTRLVKDLELSVGVVVTGHVLDPDRNPVPNAQVRARSAPTEKTRFNSIRRSETDADGFFELSGVQPGSVTIATSVQGFLSLEVDLGKIEDGDQRHDVTLALDAGMSISGRVLWTDGTAAANALVLAQRTKRARHGPSGDQSTRGDASGYFTITGLKNDTFKITATATRDVTTPSLTAEVLEGQLSTSPNAEPPRTVRMKLRGDVQPVQAGATDVVVHLLEEK